MENTKIFVMIVKVLQSNIFLLIFKWFSSYKNLHLVDLLSDALDNTFPVISMILQKRHNFPIIYSYTRSDMKITLHCYTGSTESICDRKAIKKKLFLTLKISSSRWTSCFYEWRWTNCNIVSFVQQKNKWLPATQTWQVKF